MYPRASATPPPRIAIGAVIQTSDGAVQSSGVSVVVRPEGGSETAGGGTISYGASSSVVYYTPTQAETDYTAFAVTAYKSGCIPVSVTVVTSANATAGKASVGDIATDAITAASVKADAVTKIAAGVEAAILNEGDATALLQAIADKVETALVNEGDATATILAIATAVNAAIAAGTVGSNVALILADTDEIQSGMPTSGHLAGSADAGGAAVMDSEGLRAAVGLDAADLAEQLAEILATATGFSTHSAADVLTALGTGSWATSLAQSSVWTPTIAGRIDVATSTRLAPTVAARTLNVNNDGEGAAELDSATQSQLQAIEDGVDANNGYLTTLLSRVTTTVATLWGNLTAMISGTDTTAAFTTTSLANAPAGGGGGGVASQDTLLEVLSAVQSHLGNVVVSIYTSSTTGFPRSLRKGDAASEENANAIYVRIYAPEDTEFTAPLLGIGTLLFADATTKEFALTLIDEEISEVQMDVEWLETVDDGYFLIEYDETALDAATSFISGSKTFHQWGIKVQWPTTPNARTVAEGLTKVLNPIVN